MSDRIAQLESENRQLEMGLEAASQTITELETQEDGCPGDNGLGSDEERVYLASKHRRKFHRLSCKFRPVHH